jgi:hypothetical protein
MTIATLLANTLRAAQWQQGSDDDSKALKVTLSQGRDHQPSAT